MTTFSITLYDTETEEIVGMVVPIEVINIDDFYDVIRKSFIDLHRSEYYKDGFDDIVDFVEFHNETNDVKIDWIFNEFIQLSKKDIV